MDEWKVITRDGVYILDEDSGNVMLIIDTTPVELGGRDDVMSSIVVLLGEELVHWADAETLYSVLGKVGIDCPFRVPN